MRLKEKDGHQRNLFLGSCLECDAIKFIPDRPSEMIELFVNSTIIGTNRGKVIVEKSNYAITAWELMSLKTIYYERKEWSL